MENGKQPAFCAMNEQEIIHGLTKREYFAGLAMQGLIISQGERNMVNDWGVHGSRISENALHIADELLKQLEL